MNQNKPPSQAGESATQLFSRLVSNIKSSTSSSQPTPTSVNPKLKQLESILMLNRKLDIEPKLFSSGLDNKTIAELVSKSGVGKTELIMHLISRLILPSTWTLHVANSKLTIDLSKYSSLPIDCKDFKVLLVETESSFSLLRFFTILENRLRDAFNEQKSRGSEVTLDDSLVSTQMTRFIKECLKNLVVYKCFNNEQFVLSLAACEHFIQSQLNNRTIVPIFIDTVNSNYEILDRYSSKIGLNELNHTENYALILIKRLIEKYNVCIVASRSEWTPQPSYEGAVQNQFKCSMNASYTKWQTFVNYRIQLVPNELKISRILAKENINSTDNDIVNNTFPFEIQNMGFMFV